MLPLLVALGALLAPVQADGPGIIGAGKWMYKPVCGHSCRRVISPSPLLCEEWDPLYDGTLPTPPSCFLSDRAFLRTVALCMDTHCHSRDDVPISVIEDFWEGHLATGSVGDWSLKPAMSYSEALVLAKEDVERVGRNKVPVLVSGMPLNETSFVAEPDFVIQYNGQKSFEQGETDHGRNSLAVVITTVTMPMLFSVTRFVPGLSRLTYRLNTILDQPFWGTRHRTPMKFEAGIMPTRGQALFIAYILIVNTFLSVFPYYLVQPNSHSDSDHSQLTLIIGDRTGVLAFANYVVVWLFSARNNVLLWLTNWSHSTFLLLHRWVAYVCLAQTVVHSLLMLYRYDRWHDVIAESQLPYWYWGIIATLALVIMWPLAVLPIRRRMYEIFLATHQVFAALVLIASFLHIWYLYKYNWGYEIWVYSAGGIWFVDRVLRVLRVARNGMLSATVAAVDEGGEYLRIEVDDVVADGHIYLYFPSLSWRVWECHPFSVLSSFTSPSSPLPSAVKKITEGPDPEKSGPISNVEKEITGVQTPETPFSSDADRRPFEGPIRPRATLLLRAQTGTTKVLADKVFAAGGPITLPVLVESSYHANPSIKELSNCSMLLCIAGGVGITGVLPLARTFGGPRVRLCWGVRNDTLPEATKAELAQLGKHIEVDISVGDRLPLAEIVREEVSRGNVSGMLGVVVCGPPGMADEVRRLVGEMSSSGRGVLFIDDAFSW